MLIHYGSDSARVTRQLPTTEDSFRKKVLSSKLLTLVVQVLWQGGLPAEAGCLAWARDGGKHSFLLPSVLSSLKHSKSDLRSPGLVFLALLLDLAVVEAT